MVGGEELLVFAKAIVDFDKVEASADGGSELYVGSASWKSKSTALRAAYHGQYDGGVIVPELMHNPHAGNDAEEKEDEDDYEESDGEAEDSIPPIALVAGHFCVLRLPWNVKMMGISCLRCIFGKKKKRSSC